MEKPVGKETSPAEPTAISAPEFGSLFAAWRIPFEAIARRYVRDAAVAEDLVSDSFMALWENRTRLKPDSNLKAYILKILRNKCLDWLRAKSLHLKIEQKVFNIHRRRLEADILSLQSFDPDEFFSKEIEIIVHRSLGRLPELTREVFVARRVEEMSYKEIAEKCDITVRRVEFELQKAMQQLRMALNEYLP